MWSVRAPSVALVTSPGKLPSPLKLLSSLFCGVTALARSWTSVVGFVVRVQRAGFQVSLYSQLRVHEHKRVAREKREERAHSRVVLNCPSLDIAHRRLVQSERRYGAEPRLHGFLARQSCIMSKNNFYPCIKTLIRFTHL